MVDLNNNLDQEKSCVEDCFTLSYKSRVQGIGGTIKTKSEDFVVEEIHQNGTVLEANKAINFEDLPGDFTRFALQKRDWTTEGAVRRMGKALQVNPKRFSYAGSKDKTSISTQLMSIFRVRKERILRLSLKDMKILGAWRCDQKIRMGDLLGNRFSVIVRGADASGEEPVRKIYDELRGVFPNYFGEQRFGSVRRNTHKIGEQIVRGKYETAAMIFLCDYHGETDTGSINARRNLRDTGDFRIALRDFPQHLNLERIMLEHLERHPKDYANAFRKLPRGTLLLFMHAFQSRLFNTLLSERLSRGEIVTEEGEYYCGERLGFPDPKLRTSHKTQWISGKIIGHDTELNEREIELLERLDLRKSDFSIRGIPELSSKGTNRLLFSPLKDFNFTDNVFTFSLPAGSYATIALREFLDKMKV